MRISIPNWITLARLLLALVFFGLLSLFSAVDGDTWFLLDIAFWVFLVAVLSDVLDGYLARRLKQVTSFGRVVDPVVDKVVVVGAFFFFAGPHFFDYARAQPVNISGVQMWMVLVILIRELLVSAIRSYGESHNVDFSADWAGKLKMFVQSVTACVILGQLAWFPADAHPGMLAFRQACIWTTVVVTALSIVTYARRAQSFLFSKAALGGVSPGPDETGAADTGAPEQMERPAESGGTRNERVVS